MKGTNCKLGPKLNPSYWRAPFDITAITSAAESLCLPGTLGVGPQQYRWIMPAARRHDVHGYAAVEQQCLMGAAKIVKPQSWET